MIRALLFRNFLLVYRLDHWIKRRFTAAGMLLLGIVVLAGVFGVNTRATLSYQLVTLAAALLAAGMLAAPFFRGRIRARRRLPRFATAGSPVTYAVEVHNLGGRTERGLFLREEPRPRPPSMDAWLRARDAGDAGRNAFDRAVGYPRWASLMGRSRGARPTETPLPDLAPGSRTVVDVTLVPQRRGYLRLAAPCVVRPDPLGVYRALRPAGETQSLLVLPRRYPVDWRDVQGGSRDRTGGASQAASIGGVEEFAGLREYRPGDPMRHIHWKGWARLGKPIVKEFHEECFVRQALVLDTALPDGASDARFEEAVSIAASFAGAPAAREGVLDLVFVGDRAYRIESGSGLAACDRLLEALACVEPAPPARFATLVECVAERAGELSGCVCVLLAWDDARRALVAGLRHAGAPVLALVVVEPGEEPELEPGPLVDDPRRLRAIPAGAGERALALLSARTIDGRR